MRSVPQSEVPQSPFLWSRGSAARETLRYLDRNGVAAEMDLRDAGILFYLAAASTTVAEAFEHLARYAGTANEAVHLEISQQQGETVLTARPVGWYDEPWRQFSEFIALAVIRALNRATNRDFAPSRMTFAHPRDSG